MIDIAEILQLHENTVAQWHAQPISNSYKGWLNLVCQQHIFNYELWHQEDIARGPNVSDQEIARVKRAIDKFNQQRNDCIERLDDAIGDMLALQGVQPNADARQNTETPGSAIDRLSILSLRLYHYVEQTGRRDVDAAHLDRVRERIEICRMQRADLSQALVELLADLTAGRKRHKTYRQLKMYNDPSLNPYIYSAKKGAI